MDYPRVAIVILNWNRGEDTVECLESLYQIVYPQYEVIVIDNGSCDNSVEKIKAWTRGNLEVESRFFKYDPTGKPIETIEYTREEAESGGVKEKEITNLSSDRRMRIIKNERNYGFAEGNNIGMRYALNSLNPDYILWLNNDTVVDKMFLTELINVAQCDNDIGLTEAKIYYYDYRSRTDVINFAGAGLNLWISQPSMNYGLNEIDLGQHEQIREVSKLDGACTLIKASMLKKIGLFDPRYFAYWEATELSYKASKAGFRLLYAPKSKIWHKISASSGGSLGTIAIYYFNRNRFLFMKNNSSKIQICTSLLYFFGFRFWLSIGSFILLHKNLNALRAFLRGVRDGLRFLF